MADDVLIAKRGELVIQTSFRRCRGGVRLTIKAHPSVEDLMREQGANEKISATDYGRDWISVDPRTPLMVWAGRKVEPVNVGSFYYSLDKVGRKLYSSQKESSLVGGDFNFSFIRLVGISNPEGVTFEIRGAFSLDHLKSLNEKIKDAGRRFYTDYLLPVDLTVSVVTQETKL